MPNVRHEESLDGCVLPEIIHPDPACPSRDQTLEDEQISKSDGHVCKSQYREDLKGRLDKGTFLLVVKGV